MNVTRKKSHTICRRPVNCLGRISAGTKKSVRKEIEQGTIPFVVPEN